MSNDAPEVEYTPFKPQASSRPESSSDTAEWFTSKKRGFHFSFELNDKKFEARELPQDMVKEVTRRVRALGRTSASIRQDSRKLDLQLLKLDSRRDEIRAKDELAGGDLDELSSIETSVEELFTAQEVLTDKGEGIIAEQHDIYESVVLQSLVKWDLDEELTEDAVKDLSVTAKKNLGDIVIENSMAGGDRQNFTRKKSRR